MSLESALCLLQLRKLSVTVYVIFSACGQPINIEKPQDKSDDLTLYFRELHLLLEACSSFWIFFLSEQHKHGILEKAQLWTR